MENNILTAISKNSFRERVLKNLGEKRFFNFKIKKKN